MDGGLRETLCSSCGHRDVCAHKDDYLHMVKSLQEIFYKFPENERGFMALRDPDCKFYSKEFRTPRALTQRVILTENDKEQLLKAVEDGRKNCEKLIAEKVSGSICIHHIDPITMDNTKKFDGKLGV